MSGLVIDDAADDYALTKVLCLRSGYRQAAD
jgi:hypothetical protein